MSVVAHKQRGDTIVEVTLAFTVFSMLAIGSMTIMGHSMAVAQRALEQTQVRQVMEGQADLLRTAQSTTLWDSIKANTATTADIPAAGNFTAGCPSTPPKKSFVVSHNTGSTALQYTVLTASNFKSAPVTSYVDYAASKAYGIWVQAVPVVSPAGAPLAYDMYIRSCWTTVDSKVPATQATIVRLYDKS